MMKLLLRHIAVLLMLLAWCASAATTGLIEIKGPIGPATASYIARAIDVAAERQHSCLIVELDTPGGLLESTKAIVQSFYASPIPVVVYVAPSGANAGSAGTFITIAAHIAAMAPNTSIGAAHPVAIGGGAQQEVDEVMKKKMENFASSFIETIAEKRGRNVEWAKSAVIESASISAEKALELNVIDLIAADLPALLKEIDGREVDGKVLRTAGAEVDRIPMIPRERVFQLLWRPEVMFILMLVAIYGIIGEVSNPGAIFPGVIGAIALILVLYMSAILPVNVAGLALIGLALILFVLDIFTPSHGVLTVGGIVAFFLGALMLFDRSDPAFRLSLVYIIPGTLLTIAFFLFVVGAGLRAQMLPVRAGRETLIGQTANVIVAINTQGGRVFVEGEYWNAVSDTPIPEGAAVEITGIEGLTLKVKPKN
ncbi:MAG TPA: nodulation protein NfeD [Verrucomicrobiota bacterium]|nr:nodulation protein NfeD [Verrucomicrobiota bacterium]HOP95845.1 nodulation protein NfeD [Verrucomicrobiota bacterium]